VQRSAKSLPALAHQLRSRLSRVFKSGAGSEAGGGSDSGAEGGALSPRRKSVSEALAGAMSKLFKANQVKPSSGGSSDHDGESGDAEKAGGSSVGPQADAQVHDGADVAGPGLGAELTSPVLGTEAQLRARLVPATGQVSEWVRPAAKLLLFLNL
jgi:hypothetical protein